VNLLALCMATALAGEIHVSSKKPVIILIQGADHSALPALDAKGLGLPAGVHRVEIKNMLGGVIAFQDVQLGADEVVELLYEKKRLLDVSPPPLKAALPPMLGARAYSDLEGVVRAAEAGEQRTQAIREGLEGVRISALQLGLLLDVLPAAERLAVVELVASKLSSASDFTPVLDRLAAADHERARQLLE
jgi:hypothetical protein